MNYNMEEDIALITMLSECGVIHVFSDVQYHILGGYFDFTLGSFYFLVLWWVANLTALRCEVVSGFTKSPSTLNGK